MARPAPNHAQIRGYTISKVAELVGIGAQTLRDWENAGLLVPARTAGGQRRYAEEDLRRAQRIFELRRRHGWNAAAIQMALHSEAVSPRDRSWARQLRRVRRGLGLRRDQAARRIGISSAELQSLERGEIAPTSRVTSLIADAYLSPMSALAERVDHDTPVVRQHQGLLTVISGGVTWEELATPGGALEPARLTVPPGEGSGGPYSRPGETFVLVLSGELLVSLEEPTAEWRLTAQDALKVRARQPFSWSNPSPDTPAIAAWVEHLLPGAWEPDVWRVEEDADG